MPANIALPVAHEDQVRAWRGRSRFYAIRCGRRWGKTKYGIIEGGNAASQGHPVGFFAPDYKIVSETYNEFKTILRPIQKSASKIEGIIRTFNKQGRVEFWTLNNERAGRSRFYKKTLIDEAAFTAPNMMDIWEKSIKPTLLDLGGSCTVMSNTNGADPDNFFWRICNEDIKDGVSRHGFTQFHAPTRNNPYMPADEIERLRLTTHPLVFAQEYEAEFVDWAGVQFFAEDRLTVGGRGVPDPVRCQAVFAVIDSAVKDGQEHDSTGVSYWAIVRDGAVYRLVVLDWDLVQIEGSLLETWLPEVLARLEALARSCRAHRGTLGAWVEDKGSGTILLQQAARRGLKAQAIDSKLTAVGKDARAINISGYVHQGLIKFSERAWDKATIHKRVSRNHMAHQVLTFRVGDKKAPTRADDLLDTFCYAPAIALGNPEGF